MIKEYRNMRAAWERLPREDQKIWIDFMEKMLDEWADGEKLNFFIGMVVGVCLLAALCILLRV